MATVTDMQKDLSIALLKECVDIHRFPRPPPGTPLSYSLASDILATSLILSFTHFSFISINFVLSEYLGCLRFTDACVCVFTHNCMSVYVCACECGGRVQHLVLFSTTQHLKF